MIYAKGHGEEIGQANSNQEGLRDYQDECKMQDSNSGRLRMSNRERRILNVEVGSHFSIHHSLFDIRYSKDKTFKKGNVVIPGIVA
jgi:hypothetical protein